MRVFKYLAKGRGIAETYDIYKAVRKLEPYAKMKYKGSWEDALDVSFFHILENFDPEKGDLEHYAIKVVGTIILNKNKYEIASSEQADVCMDLKSAKDYTVADNANDVLDTDFESCLNDMVSIFVNDFRFFASFSSKDRKGDYSSLFKKYSVGTIKDVQDYLSNKYKSTIVRMLGFAKSSTIRGFSEDRYLSSLDEGIEFREMLNGTAIIKRKKGYHSKRLFSVNIGDIVDDIINVFYSDCTYGMALIENLPVFVSLSGNIVSSVKDLRVCLEKELLGTLLSRTQLRVVNYERGSLVIFSSTRDTQNDITLGIFGEDYIISFDRVTVKEVFRC